MARLGIFLLLCHTSSLYGWTPQVSAPRRRTGGILRVTFDAATGKASTDEEMIIADEIAAAEAEARKTFKVGMPFRRRYTRP